MKLRTVITFLFIASTLHTMEHTTNNIADAKQIPHAHIDSEGFAIPQGAPTKSIAPSPSATQHRKRTHSIRNGSTPLITPSISSNTADQNPTEQPTDELEKRDASHSIKRPRTHCTDQMAPLLKHQSMSFEVCAFLSDDELENEFRLLLQRYPVTIQNNSAKVATLRTIFFSEVEKERTTIRANLSLKCTESFTESFD